MHVQCIRCETLVGTDRALDGEVVEEDLVGYNVGETLRSCDLQTGYYTYSLQTRMAPRQSVLWITRCAVELLLSNSPSRRTSSPALQSGLDGSYLAVATLRQTDKTTSW